MDNAVQCIAYRVKSRKHRNRARKTIHSQSHAVFQLIFQLRGEDSQGTACVHDVCISERSILIKVRPHTERVRVARPEEISRRIVQGQQRQSRLPAATKLSRSDMDVVRRCPCRSRRSGRQSRLLAAIKLVQGGKIEVTRAGPLSSP
jgi:hypothetical protein